MSVKYGLEPKSELDIILFHIVIVTFHIVSFFAIKHLKEFSTVMSSGFSLIFFYDLGILNNYTQLKSIRVSNFMIALIRYMLDVGMLCHMKTHADKDYFLTYAKMNI